MNINAIFNWIVSDLFTESQRQIDVTAALVDKSTTTPILVIWIIDAILTDEQLDTKVPSQNETLRNLRPKISELARKDDGKI